MDNFSLFDNRSRWRFSLKEANMNKIKGFVRKLVVLTLAVVSVFTFSVFPSFAAELNHSANKAESVSTGAVLRRSDKLVAYEQAEIYSDGAIKVHLNSTIWGGYLKLSASGGSGSIVNVSVVFPDGSPHVIGVCTSNGNSAISEHYMHLPKGDYTFYLDGFDHYFALASIYNS